jgi:hypothetical protein
MMHSQKTIKFGTHVRVYAMSRPRELQCYNQNCLIHVYEPWFVYDSCVCESPATRNYKYL